MRISFNMNGDLLSALDRLRQQDSTDVQQMASGRRVQVASDDPLAAGAWVLNRVQYAADDQFSRNIQGLQATMQSADSALNSVVLGLTQAITLGTQGATGTVTDQQRAVLAQQVTDIQSQVVGLANTSLHGVYLFSGTAVTTQPYVLDAAAASGVKYAGNTNTTTVEIAPGQTIQVQVPGSQIFNAPGADVFQSLRDLSNALQTGGDVVGATSSLQKALHNISIQRVPLGNTLANLNQGAQTLSDDKLQLSQRENDLVGADLAQVASDFTKTETALNAALQAGSKVSQLSLLDFLR